MWVHPGRSANLAYLNTSSRRTQPSKRLRLAGHATPRLGVAMWMLYVQGKFAAVDTILSTMAYIGLVDGNVCWQEGVLGNAIFPASAGVVIGA